MAIVYSNLGTTSLVLWGNAPTMIAEISGQEPRDNGDARRIDIAAEWWLRVWNIVDKAICGLDYPAARRELTMRYRKGIAIRAMAQLAGYTYCNMQKRLGIYANVIATAMPAEICRLIAWRVVLMREWNCPLSMRINGLELPDVALAPNNGKRRRRVDSGAIERLLREKDYMPDIVEIWAKN